VKDNAGDQFSGRKNKKKKNCSLGISQLLNCHLAVSLTIAKRDATKTITDTWRQSKQEEGATSLDF
jgi:hypothetical protein